MRVEAIVKKSGLFIPSPGFPLGKQKQILVDIVPVPAATEADPFVQAAGLLTATAPDGVNFQKKLRAEWKER